LAFANFSRLAVADRRLRRWRLWFLALMTATRFKFRATAEKLIARAATSFALMNAGRYESLYVYVKRICRVRERKRERVADEDLFLHNWSSTCSQKRMPFIGDARFIEIALIKALSHAVDISPEWPQNRTANHKRPAKVAAQHITPSILMRIHELYTDGIGLRSIFTKKYVRKMGLKHTCAQKNVNNKIFLSDGNK